MDENRENMNTDQPTTGEEESTSKSELTNDLHAAFLTKKSSPEKMDANQENVNVDRQNISKEESSKNELNHSSTESLTEKLDSNKTDESREIMNVDQQNCDGEELCTAPTLTEGSDSPDLNTLTEINIEQSLAVEELEPSQASNTNVILCNEDSDQTKIDTEKVPLTSDQTMVIVNNEKSNDNDASLDINDEPSNKLCVTEAMDVLDNIITHVCEESENCDDTVKPSSATVIKDEIVITNEIIIIDNDAVNKDGINKQTSPSENADLNNETDENQTTEDLYYIDTRTALDAIASQYDSSDAEDNNCTEATTKADAAKIVNAKNYRNKGEVVLSSDESSDSESDSSSSESEAGSNSSKGKNDKSNSDDDDSDNEKQLRARRNKPNRVFKPKGEFDDLPPIEDLKISVPEVLCDPLGEVAWTVEQMVVVHPKPGKPTLNLDTVLFIEKGQRALGHIFDVFGRVADPHYCVRFNSSDHIKECDIKVGMTVYYCPNTAYTSLVFLSELKKMKAVDDIGDDEAPQFSDDEEEQAYLASLKNKSNNNPGAKEPSNERPKKRRRGNQPVWQSNHPWNSNREHQQQQSHQANQPPHQQSHQLHNTRPFYRTHHPWSRPRHHHQQQQPNPWHQYNNHQWPVYNQMQPYNNYLAPQMQWNHPQYRMQQQQQQQQPPQMNALPAQGFAAAGLVPPFALSPPPPPPPPPGSNPET